MKRNLVALSGLVFVLLSESLFGQGFNPYGSVDSGVFDRWIRESRGEGVSRTSYASVPPSTFSLVHRYAGALKGLTRVELLGERRALQQRLILLQQQWSQAYADLQGAGAMADPFANMRPRYRNTWTLQDHFNGEILDQRYTQNPVIKLSPASRRYGQIMHQIASSQARIQTATEQAIVIQMQLQAVDQALIRYGHQ